MSAFRLVASAVPPVADVPDAVADFRQAARLTTRPSKRRLYQLRIARCESQRGRWKQALTALKDSGARYLHIQLEAEQDDALRRALDEDIIRRWLEGLPRRRGKPLRLREDAW